MATYEHKPHLEKIIGQLKGNTSIIFTNGELGEVIDVLNSQVREAPARVGSIAPKDVIVPAGFTGLDPKETNFFQKLNIMTKIVKAKIEIINDVKIINEGDKVQPGQAALLNKLKIKPFEYRMTVKTVMMDGNMFEPEVLNISSEDVLACFQKGVSNLTALSLGSGYITPMAAPHLVMHAFKNLAAVAFATDYSFPQAEALKNAAASAAVAVSSAVPEEKPREAAKAAAKEPSEKTESDAGMGGLFDDGDDDY